MVAPDPLSEALTRIGDRWSLLLVDALMPGPLRFAGLQEAVPDISTNILTARLRHLESEGVVLASPYSERPRRYSYELTEAGRDLAGAVRVLSQWSADHSGAATGPVAGGSGAGRAGGPVHQPCGTPMQAVWWCPTCERRGEPEEPGDFWV